MSREATVQPVFAISSALGRSTSPLSIALAALGPKTFQTSRHDTCTSPFDPSAAEAVDSGPAFISPSTSWTLGGTRLFFTANLQSQGFRCAQDRTDSIQCSS